MHCRVALSSLLLFAVAPAVFAAGSLTGTGTTLSAAQTFNLTTQGTGDWAHWAAASATSFDHKAGVTGGLSNYTLVGTGTVARYANNLAGYTWTDGTPTASITNSTTGIYINGTGNGFRFTVPADNTSRTLTVYVGGYNSEATLTAHLSDGSAADFTDGSYGYDKPGNYNGHNFLPVYTLTYKAATAGQTLSVSWVQTAGTGNVTLQSAALTPPAPAAPTNLVATPISASQINLTWTAPAGAVTGYNIKRSLVSGGPYTTVGTSATPSYSDTGLSAATRYYYVVTAVNGGSEGAASAEVLRTTLCAAPTNLTATATATQIGLTWTASAGATSYSLFRGTAAGGEAAYKTALTGTSYADTAVTAGTTYYYMLRAINNGGTSAASNEASATVPAAGVSLSSVTLSPTSVTGGSVVTGTVTLSGPAPAGDVSVSLSSNSAAAPVQTSVTVLAGSATGMFQVTTTSVTAATTATITATYSGVSKTATVTVNPAQTGASGSYNVVAGPINVDAVENTSGTVTAATVIEVSSVNSFTGTVQLASSGLPSGASAVLSSPTVSLASGSASSNLTFTIASTTRPGFYAVDLRATSGSITRSAPVNLTIYPAAQAANFTIAQDVDGLEIEPGGSDTVTLTLNPNAGFSGSVNLSLQDDPANPIVNTTGSGISATFSTASLSSSGQTSTVTFQVGTQVPENAYHLLIKGTSPTGTQTLIVTVFVLPSEAGLVVTDNVQPDGGPTSPPYPLASSTSDMFRYDADDVNNPPSQTSPLQTSSDLGISFDDTNQSKAKDDTIHPNFLGATDDRIYVKTESPSFSYPYSTVCKIVAYTSTGIFGGTGNLIGRNHVLTAAHVLYDDSGHLAYRIVVYPGWDNGPSRLYHHATMKSFFITNKYRALVAANPTSQEPLYDDFAIIDLNPVVGGTKADRGKELGDKAQYMMVADDFTSPDQNSFIAGYPDTVKNVKKNTNYMYYSGVGIGDDGPVSDTNNSGPFGSPEQSDNLVFHTIDVSPGNSGGGIYHPDPVGNDFLFHLYAIARGAGVGGTNYNSGTLITTTRKKLIKMLMQQDKDDVAY